MPKGGKEEAFLLCVGSPPAIIPPPSNNSLQTDGANREHRHRDVETGARLIGRRTYKPRSEVSRSYCRLGEALWVSLILAIWPKGRRMKEKEEEDFRGKNVTVEAKHEYVLYSRRMEGEVFEEFSSTLTFFCSYV